MYEEESNIDILLPDLIKILPAELWLNIKPYLWFEVVKKKLERELKFPEFDRHYTRSYSFRNRKEERYYFKLNYHSWRVDVENFDRKIYYYYMGRKRALFTTYFHGNYYLHSKFYDENGYLVGGYYFNGLGNFYR